MRAVFCFFLCFFAMLLLAEDASSSFQSNIAIENDIFKVDSSITVKIKTDFPSTHIYRGLGVHLYIGNAPPAFVEKNQAKIKQNKIAKWSSIPIQWVDIVGSRQQNKEDTYVLDTAGWPAGSYRIQFSTMFRQVKPTPGSDKYVEKSVVFVLED